MNYQQTISTQWELNFRLPGKTDYFVFQREHNVKYPRHVQDGQRAQWSTVGRRETCRCSGHLVNKTTHLSKFTHLTLRQSWSFSGRKGWSWPSRAGQQQGSSSSPLIPLSLRTDNCHKKRTLTFNDGPLSTGRRTGEEKGRRSAWPKPRKTLCWCCLWSP